ncbi:MAG: nuclear transport factor 2 family protein [Anaerolineales bacterium]|nr:nuclear transport factor 2 family protein [Anaerolineales bacterium]
MAITGKGMFVWKVRDVYGGDVVKIANQAQQDGISHVLVKIADGRYKYNITNGQDLGAALITQLRNRGIKAWGWQYIYGVDTELEAQVAGTLAKQLGVDGFVVNAEKEFKAAGMPNVAKRYMERLRQELPNMPIALSTYRYPTLHAPFPFKVFLDFCDLAMPQVYWEGASNPGQQLRRSVDEFRAVKNLPIVPTGAAYGHNGWVATPAQITAFLNEARAINLSGANFWEWATALQGDGARYAAIQAFQWPGAPGNPQPQPEPEPQPQPEPEPPAPPSDNTIYIRLKHDHQWMTDPATGKRVRSRMERSDWNNNFHFDAYPAVVPMWTGPNSGDGAYKYSRAWAEFLRASNPQHYTHLERVAAGLFNPRNDNLAFPDNLANYDGETVAEAIGSAGNVYEVLEEKSGSVRVRLIDFQSAPPTPAQLNYEDTPWLVNAFTAISKDGRLHKVTGRDLVFPNLGRPGSGWIPKERVEFFPKLPVKVSVVISQRLNVRKAPGTHNEIVDRMTQGQSATVTEYRPLGSSVWGKIGENRWIALVYTTTGGPEYYTNWKMETSPPLALSDPRPYLKPMTSPAQQAGAAAPNPNNIVRQYFAALNKAVPHQVAALYAPNGQLVAKERAYTGHKALNDWFYRFLNKDLPGATFTLVNSKQEGNLYKIRWIAHGKNSKVLNGNDLIRVSPTAPGSISYHYSDFKVIK